MREHTHTHTHTHTHMHTSLSFSQKGSELCGYRFIFLGQVIIITTNTYVTLHNRYCSEHSTYLYILISSAQQLSEVGTIIILILQLSRLREVM